MPFHTDVALNARGRPVTAKDLTARHHLSPRNLEHVLGALAREGILKGVRGPHGGYELAREPRRITVDDILRVVRSVDDDTEGFDSPLVRQVVYPLLARAENAFSKALAQINVERLVRSAAALRKRRA